MNFLIFASKPNDYMESDVIKILMEEGFHFYFTDGTELHNDVEFSLYAYECSYLHLLKDENIPFLILLDYEDREIPQIDSRNFKGFIDSNANPYAIISHLRSILKNIKDIRAIKTNTKIIESYTKDISNIKGAQEELEATLSHMEDIIKERTASLKSARALTMESLATLSEYRDNETGAHIQRTKLYVKFLLEKIKHRLLYSEDEIEQIWTSAPLHDIGKVAIPDSILLKHGRLTSDEFEIMKTHVIRGNEALMRVSEEKEDDSYLKFAKEITLFHHEKWDGSGYPYGLSGVDIPISARLMALADVYDALRSERPYKKGLDHETAMAMIVEEKGKHFDPHLVELFIKYNHEFDNIFQESINHPLNTCF